MNRTYPHGVRATLLALIVAVGCGGSDDSGGASPSSSPPPDSAGAPGATQAGASGAGGTGTSPDPEQSLDGTLAEGNGDGDGGREDDQADGRDPDGDGATGPEDSGAEPATAEADLDPVGDALTVWPNPMYSAFDGTHDFVVPALALGTPVRWSSSDPTLVALAPDATTGGILITTLGSGEVEIIARAGESSGSATLFITAATPEEWSLGRTLYTSELRALDPDASTGEITRCTDCHGEDAQLLNVEYSAETAGYSDEELIGVFVNGTKPAFASFSGPFPADLFETFHRWDVTAAEQRALLVYVRSLQR